MLIHFPSEVFNLGQPYIHRDIRGQTINFIPFGFNPVRKTIKIYNKIRVKITFLTKELGINELSNLQENLYPMQLKIPIKEDI